MDLRHLTIPRGKTEPGATKAVITYLYSLERNLDGARFLDIGCGSGELLQVLRKLFPSSYLMGADIDVSKFQLNEPVVEMDASKPFPLNPDVKFDVIISISAMGAFDNLRSFVESCAEHLNSEGILILVGENYYDVRDRLSFFFFGRLRRHRLLIPLPGRGSAATRAVMLGEISQLYADNGLDLEVQYTSLLKQDTLLIPLACFLYILSVFYLLLARSTTTLSSRLRMYPFSALLCRSQLVIGHKK